VLPTCDWLIAPRRDCVGETSKARVVPATHAFDVSLSAFP
jgi:hypothetical protein